MSTRKYAIALLFGLGACAGRTDVPATSDGRVPSLGHMAGEAETADLVSAIRQEIETLAADDQFSGVVLVSKNGMPLFRRAYGYSDPNKTAENTPETQFNIGSLNKMFTAVAIGQLAESGKLSFDDPIGKHLPEYPNRAAADQVTIHHLLTMTSGLPGYMGQLQPRRAPLGSLREYLPLFADQPLKFQPGDRFDYSNSNYILLGRIVEAVSGQNYYDYVRERIYEPAGMVGTAHLAHGGSARQAIGMTRNGSADGTRRSNTDLIVPGASDGGGYSTADDMARFADALLRHKLLGPETLQEVTTGKVPLGPSLSFAYGFGDMNQDGVRNFDYDGGIPGVNAHWAAFPVSGYSVVVLANYDPPAAMQLFKSIRPHLVQHLRRSAASR